MDRSVDVEESHCKSDSLACKSLGSLVHVDSMAIEISGAMGEIGLPVHEHFSIRGYVSEMRKKDRRICSPFTSEGGDRDNVTCNLPPLSVPAFRWWQCSNCIADIPSEMSKELVIAGNVTPVFNGGLAKRTDGIKDNDVVNKNIGNANLACIRGRKAARSKKAKRAIKDKEAATEYYDVQEAHPLQIIKRADIADTLHAALPPCPIDHVSSGSDDAPLVLPCKRKPKLRSLADIMVEQKKSNGYDTSQTQSASSSGVRDTFVSPHLEASSSLQRKRKSAFEEDRVSVKRSKGLVLAADRTCKRPVASEQESEEEEEKEKEERGAAMKLNSLVSAKARLVRLRKNKGLVGRKSKQSQTEDGVVLARDLQQTNSPFVENFEDNVAVSTQSNATKIRNGPNSSEEMGHVSTSLPSGNERGTISTAPNRERPQFEADGGHLVPPLKSPTEDGNGKGKVPPLDLSLNSFMDAEENSNDQESAGKRRFIPDLNEEFPAKTVTLPGKHLPSLHNGDLQMRKYMVHDVHDSSNEEPIEVERPFGPSNPRKNSEIGEKIASASDDIPMEIVELLAKNQHERALGISKKHLLPEEMSSCTKSCPPLYTDGSRNTICFPFSDRTSVANAPNRMLGFPLNFSQLNSSSRDAPKPQESQFRFFNSYAPNEQRIMQFPSSSSSFITAPRISGRSELYWPPRRDNEAFAVGLNHNRSVQESNAGLRLPLFADKHVRGKTVSNAKEIERKKTFHEGILLNKGRIGSSSKDVGPLYPYSNDTIPAMQLLSLMDLSSGPSSLKSGPKNFLEKPPSLGPRVNGKEKQSTQSYHCFKDFPKLGGGVFVPGESSKKGQTPMELGNSTAMKSKSDYPSLVVCTLNMNPADFSIPEAKNKYTITARDLKPRKRIPRKEKPTNVSEDGRKRQRLKNKDVSSSGKSKAASENI